MRNQELRSILLKELNIENLPEEAQDEVIAGIGDTILKSVTLKIFEELSTEDRKRFEAVSAQGDDDLIQQFLEMAVPNMHILMETEIKKTLQAYKEKEEKKALGQETLQ